MQEQRTRPQELPHRRRSPHSVQRPPHVQAPVQGARPRGVQLPRHARAGGGAGRPHGGADPAAAQVCVWLVTFFFACLQRHPPLPPHPVAAPALLRAGSTLPPRTRSTLSPALPRTRSTLPRTRSTRRAQGEVQAAVLEHFSRRELLPVAGQLAGSGARQAATRGQQEDGLGVRGHGAGGGRARQRRRLHPGRLVRGSGAASARCAGVVFVCGARFEARVVRVRAVVQVHVPGRAAGALRQPDGGARCVRHQRGLRHQRVRTPCPRRVLCSGLSHSCSQVARWPWRCWGRRAWNGWTRQSR